MDEAEFSEIGVLKSCLGCGASRRLISGLCRRCQELTQPSCPDRSQGAVHTTTTLLLAAGLVFGVRSGSLSTMIVPHPGQGSGAYTESCSGCCYRPNLHPWNLIEQKQ